MNITKKPQIKNRSVLNTNPTSAETVVSAIPGLLVFNKSNKLISGTDIFFIIFVIKTILFMNILYTGVIKKQLLIGRFRYALFAWINSLVTFLQKAVI